mmetsp:Transcript_54554/g.152173  ORF Transcript_54554/g.152173 Transcript_54554/m.152173 type:complete len:497 (+) Transcript_54554:44-1534(+)
MHAGAAVRSTASLVGRLTGLCSAPVVLRAERRPLHMAPTATQPTHGVPTWEALREEMLASKACQRLAEEDRQRSLGRGPPHRASKLRLFGASSEAEVRVTLYRDSAAWCPYCQKLWIMLEEKQVPYRVELINMRSYGDKSSAYLAKVPRGLLPALELDGTMYTESLDIMAMVDNVFKESAGHRQMLPPRGTDDWQRLERLLRLERELFSAWCSFVFHGGNGAQWQFERTMDKVEAALGETPGPWFLHTDGPSLVDLQYVSHVERMVASVPYWKGVVIRGSGMYPNIERWFEAFEQRPSYTATKSDWYTHIKDIPPQYGPGVPVKAAAAIASALDGADEAWRLPLPQLAQSQAPSDILQPGWEAFEGDAPYEAAWRIASNHEAIARFMTRGAGPGGGWSRGRRDRAELADPYAPTCDELVPHADEALRVVTKMLLDGAVPVDVHAALAVDLKKGGSGEALAKCCEYLRDRVGVPRDMSYPAARTLRGSLNYVIGQLA